MMTVGTPIMWTLFGLFVHVALALDFFALSRQGAHKVSMREAGVWSFVWVAVSFLFVGWLWWYLGGLGDDAAARALAETKAIKFITGYLIEKALAVDNVFVFLMLFTYFLLAGAHERFHLLSYGLALVLAFIGIKMLIVDFYKIPVAWSLSATVGMLAATMLLSLYIPPKDKGGSAYPFSPKTPPTSEDDKS